MKKIVLLLVITLLAVPVMADPVVTLVAGSSAELVDVMYDANGGPLPSGFGLTVTVSDGNIVDVNGFKTGVSSAATTKGYGIFPGQVVIAGGVITEPNTPVASQTAQEVILEFGALYDRDIPTDAPATSGKLCTIEVDTSCTVTVVGDDARAGTGKGIIDENLDAYAVDSFFDVSLAPAVCLGDMDSDADVDVTDLNLLVGLLSAHQKEVFPGSGALGIWEYIAVDGVDAGYNSVGDMDSDGDNDVTDLNLLVGLLSANQREVFPGSGALGIWEYVYDCP